MRWELIFCAFIAPVVSSFEEFGDLAAIFNQGVHQEYEESLLHARAKLDSFAEVGFKTVLERNERAKRLNAERQKRGHVKQHSHPGYQGGHGRKIAPEKAQKISCFVEGMHQTRNLVLKELKIPASVTVKEALEDLGQLSEEVCHNLARSCEVEDELLKKDETRQACDFTKPYRSYDGRCEHLANGEYGSAGRHFRRLIPAKYGPNDAMRNPDINPRKVSSIMNKSPRTSPTPTFSELTLMWMQFGQFVDHDVTASHEAKVVDECCLDFVNQGDTDPNCFAIGISADDPFYKSYPGLNCMTFHRSLASGKISCGLADYAVREHENSVTAYLDGSQIYGSSLEQMNSLRDGHILIPSTDSETPIGSCNRQTLNFLPPSFKVGEEFRAGDFRVNEQPGLTSIHTIFMRFHNLIAEELRTKRPSWTALRVFEEARRYVIGVLQHIVYNEFLPAMFPLDVRTQFGVTVGGTNSFQFDPKRNPDIMSEFSVFAFRVGHTLIQNELTDGTPPLVLSENFDDGSVIRQLPFSPTYVLGNESTLPAQPVNTNFASGVNTQLFREATKEYGEDLLARNIQRGRDHGLTDYNGLREYLGLGKISCENLKAYMRQGDAERILEAYWNVDDIDAFVGSTAELPKPGHHIGPVISSTILAQFNFLKYGDRRFYEGEFIGAELNAIRATTLSDVLCLTTCIVELPPRVMLKTAGNNLPISCQQRTHTHILKYVQGL